MAGQGARAGDIACLRSPAWISHYSLENPFHEKFILGIAPLLSSIALPSHALELWHSNLVWGGQGICAAQFSFDSGGEAFSQLQVNVVVLNKAGKKVASGTLSVEQIGDANANRYADALLESESLCEDDLTIRITQATALMDDKPVDLLKTQMLSVRQFTPFKIVIGK